jgi:hypothetical protein
VYGTSGGALTGCLLFLDIDLDALAEYVFICVAKARSSWRGKFLLRHYCRGAIEQFCTRDAHKILQGRFEISITRIFPWYKNLRVNQFPSYEFLVRALLCSACLVPLAGLPMWLPGYGLCFDGGVSDFQLFKGLARNGTFCKMHCRKTNPKDIVVVCPFYSSRADIRPSKFVPIWWAFFPPEPYKLKELFELGQKDAHAWADKQEEKTPEGSPRGAEAERARAAGDFDASMSPPRKSGGLDDGVRRPATESESGSESDDSADDWEWRRREKAAAAAARDGAKAGAAAWRASGPDSNSRWWTYGARQNPPARRRRGDAADERRGSRASVTRETESGKATTRTPSSPSRARRSLDGAGGSGSFWSPRSRGDAGDGGGSGGFTEWAAECQEWASLSAEAAARRAVEAAKLAAKKADSFARHETDLVVQYTSGKFCEAQAAAEAMQRVAKAQAEKRARDAVSKEIENETKREEAIGNGASSGDGGGVRRVFRKHRLVVKWLACLLVYFELVCQAALHSAAAALATICFFVPGVSARRLWKRSEEFYRPLPRVLLQPVPGVRVGAKINLETARLLGNICVTYRLLCYAVHLEVYA